MTDKQWEKLLKDFVKRFALTEDITPCLNKKAKRGTLTYILYSKYGNKVIGKLQAVVHSIIFLLITTNYEINKEKYCEYIPNLTKTQTLQYIFCNNFIS